MDARSGTIQAGHVAAPTETDRNLPGYETPVTTHQTGPYVRTTETSDTHDSSYRTPDAEYVEIVDNPNNVPSTRQVL